MSSTGWQVEYFRDRRGRVPVQEWLDKDVRRAGPKHVARVLALIDLLAQDGLSLGTEHVKKVRGDLWELRATFARNPYRILFYNPQGTTLVLLHGFLKHTEAIDERDISKAMTRMEEDRKRRGL